MLGLVIMNIKDSIYKRVDVSSGGSLVAEIDTKVLLDVCDEWSIFKDNYLCDCDNNYGRGCKYPDKYRDGGCS